jgi:hypothetical protein
MSTVSDENSAKAGLKAPGILRLTNWPLVDDGPRAWPLIVTGFGLSVFAGYWSQSIAMGALCLAVINLAIWRIWIPVYFELGPKGIGQTTLGRPSKTPWKAIARYEITRRGVVLLPENNRISFRSIYIRWRERREQLLELVRYYVLARSADENSGVRGGQ